MIAGDFLYSFIFMEGVSCVLVLSYHSCWLIFLLICLGGCVGTIELDDYPLRRISVDLQISVVNVEYR